jgi:hypothetical protein
MNFMEISGIFHLIALLLSYLFGVTSAILTGKKNNIHPSVTLLLILICTLCYIFFSELFISHAGKWHSLLQTGFPHIDRTVGLAGIVAGLFLSGLLLRIPVSIIHKFSLPVLMVYAISNFGCLGGHCGEIPKNVPGFQELATPDFWLYLQKGSLINYLDFAVLLKIAGGLAVAGFIYSFRNKIKNPKNLSLVVLSVILSMGFINLFSVPSNAVFNRLMGMNIFQWAILVSNSLLLISVFTNESVTTKRFPRLKIKPPPNTIMISIYLMIFFLVFPDASFLSDTNLQLFIIGFSLTTVFLVYYIHTRIQPYVIRYTTIVVLLGVGMVFLQANIPTTQNIPGNSKKAGEFDIWDIFPAEKVDNPVPSDRPLTPYKIQLPVGFNVSFKPDYSFAGAKDKKNKKVNN